MGDDRLNLMVGVLLISDGFGRVPEQQYLRALFGVLFGLFLVVLCWRGLGPKRKPVEQPEVHP